MGLLFKFSRSTFILLVEKRWTLFHQNTCLILLTSNLDEPWSRSPTICAKIRLQFVNQNYRVNSSCVAFTIMLREFNRRQNHGQKPTSKVSFTAVNQVYREKRVAIIKAIIFMGFSPALALEGSLRLYCTIFCPFLFFQHHHRFTTATVTNSLLPEYIFSFISHRSWMEDSHQVEVCVFL